MNVVRRGRFALVILTILVVPLIAPADPVEQSPVGELTMSINHPPHDPMPGRATLVIHNADRDAAGGTVYFGFRIMGNEDIEMGTFGLPSGASCVVSDFAGRNTGGWQGAEAFGLGQSEAGTSPNAHMRMIGGYLKPGPVSAGGCGDLTVDITFRTTPLVAFYGAFFGRQAAPWHESYDAAPWDTVPTDGEPDYEEWWNLWGTFDTLGYSNACTFTGTTPGDADCG